MAINEYFQGDDEGFDHPRLQHWRRLIQDGAQLQLEVVRAKSGLDVGRPVLYVTVSTKGQRNLEHEDWSDALNRGLIKLGVRASNEEFRFGLAFEGAFEPAEDRVGDGFFNSVLVETLQQGPLAPRLEDVLKQTHALRPSRESPSYAACRELIVAAIRGRARELTHDLCYPEPQANDILIAALIIYLDERFSITERRRLGFG
jgi:hypothetical protein